MTAKMEREVRQHLPDDLVEKIITMLPFPAIFKAQCLSKTWRARLSSFSADNEEAKRCLVPSCHRQVFEASSSWDTNWPVFVKKGRFFGYDRISQTWRRVPSLSFLPHDEVFESGVPLSGRTMFESTQMQIEGPILFTCRLETRQSKCVLYVANILTRIRLQLLPLLTDRVFYRKLVIVKSAKAYKVILLGYMEKDHSVGPFRTSISIQTYDSDSDAWSMDFFQDLQWPYCPSSAALHEGILYIVSCEESQVLLTYSLQDGTLQRLSLDFEDGILGWAAGWRRNFAVESVNLLLNKSDLLMAVIMWHFELRRVKSRFLVLRVDLASGRLLLLANTQLVEGKKRYTECVIYGSSILCGMDGPRSTSVVQCNLDTAAWSDFRAPSGGHEWLGSCFQPGVNPFMVV